MVYYIYKVECRTAGHFYIAFTREPEHRFLQHRKGLGSEFTSKHGVKRIRTVDTARTLRQAKSKEALWYRRIVRENPRAVVRGAGNSGRCPCCD